MSKRKTQETPAGEEISIPKRDEFMKNLGKVANERKKSPPDDAVK